MGPFEQNDHRFGSAIELIRLLRDLTITKQILLGARYRQSSMNPIDYAYSALQVGIKALKTDSMEHKCLLRYIDNTCTDGDVVIRNIYTLDDGKEACDIPNKRLLFHGSRNENIVGILKHGLLIAPPEAPHSGFAFGKGVYFADQFQKAYGYTSGSQSRSFVFVAEVALGESYLPTGCEYMEKSKEGSQSTHALGQSHPDDKFDITIHDTGDRIPLGATKKTANKDSNTSVWIKMQNGRQMGHLVNEEAEKIERVRRDPNTKFPLTLSITDNDIEQKVTLLGPNSKMAKMVPVPKVKEDESKDDNNMEVDESDESNIRISSFGNSLNSTDLKSAGTVTTLSRQENNTQNGGICQYSEFIVYDTKQIRLKYLIEVTSQYHAKSNFMKKKEGSNGDDNDDDDDYDEDIVAATIDEEDSDDEDEEDSEEEDSEDCSD